MDFDLLLRWCSERASGPLAVFRESHDWLQASERAKTSPSTSAWSGTEKWTWTLRSLAALGHVEVDWLGRRWHVAPPVISSLTDGGGYALLCGGRSGALLRRLDELDRDEDVRVRDIAADVFFERPVPQAQGPALRLLQATHPDNLQHLCTLLGVEFVDRAADRLLLALPDLNDLLFPGRRLDIPGGIAPARMTDLPDCALFPDLDHDRGEAGAYEVRLYDAPRYFYRHAPGTVFEAERGAVVYAELRRSGRHVLRYSRESQALLVPPRLRLPELFERAVVLCSGLLPTLTVVPQPAVSGSHAQRSKLLQYVNVRPAFAESLARRLGQRLTFV